MNKLLKSIVCVATGLAMAIGVGVGVASREAKAMHADNTSWSLVDAANLVTNDTVVIVDKTSARAMSNNNGTGSAPAATSITLNSDKTKITSEVAATLQWTITVSNSSYQFAVPGSENKLYCTNTNNGVRVGSNSNNSFTIDSGFLFNSGTSRYVGVYNNQDWRCYTTNTGNIANTLLAFYKLTNEGSGGATKLSTPAPQYDSDLNKIIWEDVPFADHYEVSVNSESDYHTATSPFDGNFQVGVDYTVRVKAISGDNDHLDSDVGTKAFTAVSPFDSKEFSLCTSTDDLEIGTSYMITSHRTGSGKTMSTAETANNRPAVDIDVVDSKIVSKRDVLTVTLGGSTGSWTFHTDNYLGTAGFFASGTGSNNHLRVLPSGTDSCAISFNNDAAVITFKTNASRNIVRYNSSNSIFACYSSGQADVYLWKEIYTGTTYTVSFSDTLGGNTFDDVEVHAGATISDLPQPTRPNDAANQIKYPFAGWYYLDGNEEKQFTSETVVNSDLSLYSKYGEVHYNVVTFNSNGGSAVASQEVEDGEKAVKPTAPTKDGYSFDGWYSDEELETPYNFNSIPDSNFTLYAKWTLVAIQDNGVFVKVTRTSDVVDGKYLIVYNDSDKQNAKAFNGVLDNLDATPNTVSVTFDGDYILKTNVNSSYFTIDATNGYIKSASGLYIGRSGSSNGISSNSTPSDSLVNTIAIDDDGNAVITASNDYVLRYNSTSGQEKFRYFGSGQQPIQLYKFTNYCTVTFNSNGGNSISPITVLSGSTISDLPAASKPSDSTYHYAFLGWYTTSDFQNGTEFTASTAVTGNLTVYAKYETTSIDSPKAYLESVTSIATIYGNETTSIGSANKSLTLSDQFNSDTNLDTLTIGSVNVAFAKGSGTNAPKYFSNGTNARIYLNNTITFTSQVNITKIEFEYDGSYNTGLSASVGEFDSDHVWTGSAKSIILTNNVGSSQVRFTAISVTYETQTTSVSDIVLRFGIKIPTTDWDNIVAHQGWEIQDYGVMMYLTHSAAATPSVESQFNLDPDIDDPDYVAVGHRDSGLTPAIDGLGNYNFTVKVSVPENFDHNAYFVVNPFLKINGEYIFLLDEDIHESVSSLALPGHNSGTNLSEAGLAYLAGN